MRAYFTASVVGKRYYLANYLKIIDILKEKSIKVISSHIIDVTEEEIRLESKEKRIAFHRQLEKWINSANFMMVEASFPSISVGYEISLALTLGKPVLMLYCNEEPPALFAHQEDDKLVCERYTLETLKDIIHDFISYVQGTSDTRFTFFITNEIAAYLDKVARKEKLPKSVYLRKLIEKDMASHH